MVLRCDLSFHFWLKYGTEDAGIKKAGIFYLIFSQKMGIMATAAPKRKSFPHLPSLGHSAWRWIYDGYVTDDNTVPDFPSRVGENIRLENVQFHAETVMKLSQKIKPELFQGPDGYPPYLLKKILPAIADPICMLFQSFMSVGKIPLQWKSAVITPLHKNSIHV